MGDGLTRTVCDTSICTGCKACLNVCSKNAITVKDNIDAFETQIDTQKCIDCGACTKVCPGLNPRDLKESIFVRQGWAKDEIRMNSSSGGAAAELTKAFIRNGGYVASCAFRDGSFTFVVTNDIDEAKMFAGSKYVKSDPQLIYKEVRELLAKGSRVLFIGLPCQVAAVLNVCDDHAGLYTADLICHGTPSAQILKQYLAENGMDIDNAKDLKFRKDNDFGIYVDGKRLMPGKATDPYTYAFLKSADYIESCYACRYATYKRVSDISLGDAWGQMADTDERCVSLIMCQTEKGRELIENAELELFDVDIEKAIEANAQLRHPSIKPPQRDAIMRRIKDGKSVSEAVSKAFPVHSLKNTVKRFLGR